ncbi:hypothetical protein LR48_Vigan10g138900 [Vigna angularis]|uniref:Transposase (putative) gypsy type domain-containing protein n=1 Tax=Phaseolus angularis TaxID=3914 RepID=A0A0L9VKT7_PHAAN|nr:hypothetical protein LR48_Vigan10g138900 [Vigna angularis]
MAAEGKKPTHALTAERYFTAERHTYGLGPKFSFVAPYFGVHKFVHQSSTSVSSSFLEKSEREVDSRPESPFYGGERFINAMSLFLLKGDVRIDREIAKPSGGWPRIKGYGWASHDVTFRSDYNTREELQWWADRSHIVCDMEDARLIRLGVSHRNERVFHGKGTSEEDFFSVYTYMFSRLFLRVPFTAFQAVVLRDLNVAPSQLHPNGWAAIQAFVMICAAMEITPFVAIFLHYFNVQPLTRRRWVSLSTVHRRTLLKPYSESFKNFKTRYFKVIIRDAGQSEFHDEAGLPWFPFYWTRDPRKINTWAVGRVTRQELEAVRIINTLPVALVPATFYMSLPVPHKTSFSSSHKRQGESSSKARDPRTASLSHASAFIKIRSMVLLTEQVTVAVAQPTMVVDLEPCTRTAPIAMAVPSSEKKRKSKEGEKSSSKRNCREGSSPHPIPASVFDPKFHVSSHMNFHMSSSQRAVDKFMNTEKWRQKLV